MVDPRRLDLSGVTPRPQPVRPGDLGSGDRETISDDEKAWLKGNPWLVRLRIASLVGLVVAAVIVSRMVYRRFQR
jgi:hypothetical protein